MTNILKKGIYKILRTIQVNFPLLQDAKFKFTRFIRKLYKFPAESDFEGLSYIEGIEKMEFIDIGANRGDTVLSIRLFAKNAKILAFEPNPLVFNKLNFLLKRDTHTKIINAGLGDSEGSFGLFVPFYKNFMFDGLASFVEQEAKDWLKTRVYFYNEKHLILKKVNCSVKVLDQFSVSPDFIKIDVQGFEFKVLKGGEKTFEKSKPILLIETPTNEVDNYLKSKEYFAFRFSKGIGFEKGQGHLNTYYFHVTKLNLIKNTVIY